VQTEGVNASETMRLQMKPRPCKRCHRYVETDVAKPATRRTRRQVTSVKRCDVRFTSECRLSVDVDNLNNLFSYMSA